jgi:hypothetical protein
MNAFIIKSHLKHNRDNGYDSDDYTQLPYFAIVERILFFNNINDLINDIIEIRNELIRSK